MLCSFQRTNWGRCECLSWSPFSEDEALVVLWFFPAFWGSLWGRKGFWAHRLFYLALLLYLSLLGWLRPFSDWQQKRRQLLSPAQATVIPSANLGPPQRTALLGDIHPMELRIMELHNSTWFCSANSTCLLASLAFRSNLASWSLGDQAVHTQGISIRLSATGQRSRLPRRPSPIN